MKLARATLLLLFSGCLLDFDGLLSRCRDGEGACAPGDGGVGGGSTGGGGASGGGSTGGGSGGGSAPPLAEGFCLQHDAGRFCWENPLPQGNALTSSWGSSPDDVWLGGAANTLMHWDGGGWTSYQQQLFPSRAGDTFVEGLWGDGRGFVIATNTLTEPFTRTSTGEWVLDVISGQARLRGITGTDQRNLWAAGETGQLWHFDSTAWSATNTGLNENGTRVALSPDGGQLLSIFEGHAMLCETSNCATTVRELVDSGTTPLAGVAWTDLGAVVVDQNGNLWEGMPGAGFGPRLVGSPAPDVFALAALPDAGLIIAGEQNRIFRRTRPDGGWVPTNVQPPLSGQRFATLFTFSGETGSVVAGAGGLIHRLQSNGTWRLTTQGPISPFVSALETAEGHFLVASDNGLIVRDGGRWQVADGPMEPQNPVSFARALDGGAWIGTGDGRLERWQRPGRAVPYWSSGVGAFTTSVAALPSGVAAVVGGNVYLVSSPDASTLDLDAAGTVTHVDGWDEAHLWAVTNDGRVASRSADAGWTFQLLQGELRYVFADRDAGVFVCGTEADLANAWHLEPNGTTFAKDLVLIPADGVGQRLRAIGGTSAQNLWMIADYGRLYRWDGPATTWRLAAETGTRQLLNALIVHERELWMIGDQGTVIHYTY